MRLREIQHILRQHSPVTADGSAFGGAGGNQAFKVKGYSKAVQSLTALAAVPSFQEVATGILRSGFFAEPVEGDEIPVAGHVYSSVKPRIDALNVRAKDLLDTMDSILGSEDEHGIAVRLPDGVGDMADLTGATAEFQSVMDDSLALLGCDRTRFVGFDRGSSWIEIVGDEKSILVITGLYYAANKVVADVLRYKRQLQDIEASELENEERRELVKSHKLLNRKLRRSEAKKLAGSVLTEVDAEVTGKIAAAIERLGKLIMRGAEIRLALGAGQAAKEQASATKMIREAVVKELGGSIPQLGTGAVQDLDDPEQE